MEIKEQQAREEEIKIYKNEFPNDLEECPRCWYVIENIIWGQTNCPNCHLHFECC
jgi:uncharacterized protein (UPF0212 family)